MPGKQQSATWNSIVVSKRASHRARLGFVAALAVLMTNANVVFAQQPTPAPAAPPVAVADQIDVKAIDALTSMASR
jgi:hypothetical protein